jgi:Uma2 family endonuclease
MTAAEKWQLVSVSDYLASELKSDRKHEFIGGEVYAMAGASNLHNDIVLNTLTHLHNQLRGGPCRPFNSGTKVRIRFSSHTRFYYPDGMVVCRPNSSEESFQDEPVILFEVVSPATRRTDEREKREAYLEIPSVQSYLLIEQASPLIVAFHRGETGFERRVYSGLETVVPLAAIDAELPLGEVYEGIEFTGEAGLADEPVVG